MAAAAVYRHQRTMRLCAVRRLIVPRYSFDVAAAEGESPYFCVFEADFDDAAALSAARASPEGQAVRADIPNYATGGAVALNYEFRAG